MTSELTTDGGVVPVVVERVVTSSVESSDHLTSLHSLTCKGVEGNNRWGRVITSSRGGRVGGNQRADNQVG